MQVAQTILAQLGGREFIMLTGAKNLVGSEDSLMMKIGKNPKKITHVKVVLTPADLYKVQFIKYNARSFENKVVEEFDEVFCDMLRDIFERHTGLFVSFRSRG